MTEQMSIEAKVPANEKKGTPQIGPVTVAVTTGSTAKEMIEMFGDEPVKSNANAHWTVTVQAGIRRDLSAGKSEKEIQTKYASAKMGVAAARTTGVTIDAIKAAWPTMSAEDKKTLLADLQKSK